MIEASKNQLGELHGPACFTYSENESIIHGRFQAGEPIGFWVSLRDGKNIGVRYYDMSKAGDKRRLGEILAADFKFDLDKGRNKWKL